MLFLYLMVSILWAIYATLQTKKKYPDNNNFWNCVAFLINLVICPLAIFIAIIQELINE